MRVQHQLGMRVRWFQFQLRLASANFVSDCCGICGFSSSHSVSKAAFDDLSCFKNETPSRNTACHGIIVSIQGHQCTYDHHQPTQNVRFLLDSFPRCLQCLQPDLDQLEDIP